MGVLTAVVAGLLAVWAAVTAALVVLMVRHDLRVADPDRADRDEAYTLLRRPRCACGEYWCDGVDMVITDHGVQHTEDRCQPAREAL